MSEEGRMNDPEIDRILTKQDEIAPSSGFVASVMDAVRCEALAPPPIPFPWKRALPVLLLAALAVTLVAAAGIAIISQPAGGSVAVRIASHTPSLPTPAVPPSLLKGAIGTAVVWTGLALLLALVSVKASLRMASSRT